MNRFRKSASGFNFDLNKLGGDVNKCMSRLNRFCFAHNRFKSELKHFRSRLNLFVLELNLFRSGPNLFALALNLFSFYRRGFRPKMNPLPCAPRRSGLGRVVGPYDVQALVGHARPA